MNSDQKKIAALAVLGLTWGGLLAWQFLTWEEPVRVPLTNISGPASGATQLRGAPGTLHVQLELLAAAHNQREMVFSTPRNIFALPTVAGLHQEGTAEVSDLAVRQQAVATELAQFHYLGFVRLGEDWQKRQDLAVLTKNDDLHVVKKGETVENHVLVKAITQESVTLQDRDSRVEYTVMLSEEPLTQ
ncbi:MAG TPA: hypothetical protein VKP13_00085 [Nitrospira sp.]|nr:hypothetical protein [Nitrospira sp.]